jgi:hypothetical protein
VTRAERSSRELMQIERLQHELRRQDRAARLEERYGLTLVVDADLDAQEARVFVVGVVAALVLLLATLAGWLPL